MKSTGFLARAITALRPSKRIPVQQAAQVLVELSGQQMSIGDALAIFQTAFSQQAGNIPLTLTRSQVKTAFTRWQYAGATAIADAVMMCELLVQKREKDGWKNVPGHDLELLLSRVNPLMTGEELIYLAVLDLCFTGEAFWFIAMNGMAEPAELWPLLGNMEPKLDKDHIMTKWVHTYYDGKTYQTKDLEPAEVVYLRLPKPGVLLGGFGPTQAAGAAIALDEEMLKSEYKSFRQGIMPRAILKMTEQDAVKREQLLKNFNDKYQSDQGAIGVSTMMDVIWPQTAPKDMGYGEGRMRNKEDVLGVQRVPDAILGISKDVNRASAEGMEYIFSKWRITPILRMICARLTQDLAVRFWGDEVRVWFVSPVPDDKVAILNEIAVLLDRGAMTINEVRQTKLSLPPVPWGERPFLPIGRAQVGPNGEMPSLGGGTQSAQLALPAPDQQSLAAAEKRRRIAAHFLVHKSSIEAKYSKGMAVVFDEVGQAVLAAWDDVRPNFADYQSLALGNPAQGGALLSARDVAELALPDPVDGVLQVGDLQAQIAARMRRIISRGIYLGGSFEGAVLKKDVAWAWDESSKEITEYAARYGAAHFRDIALETRVQYVNVVADGIAKSLSWDEIRAQIVSTMGAMKESRAANIATTESTKLYGAGGQAFREANGIGKKHWVCSFVNSRDTHMAADGQVRDNGEPFNVGGDSMMFPGEGSDAGENCNCNCCATAYFD